MGGNGARHASGSGKKPGTKKEAGWVLSFWSGFPAASAAAIHRWCRLHCPRRFTVLLCCWLTSTRFQMGARRFRWEGVGDRGLRCQRPPPLEVGREQMHLCCLLFFWTCPAICLSLSCSPATGRLWVLGSKRLQLYARCHLDGAWLQGRRRRWWVGGRAENPALPQKGEEVQKCRDWKKKVEHYPLSS